MVKRNTKRNHIVAVLKEDGSSTQSQEEVADEFIKYFEGLLGTENTCDPLDPNVFSNGPRISDQQSTDLEKCFSAQEIKEALFDIDDDKSPGRMGILRVSLRKHGRRLGMMFVGLFKNSLILRLYSNKLIIP
ncbi:Uncharacterized protein Adt_34702 [Abeliophyllum distichum]|uniref:Uncharacterized protein n=1 Tax=Abeliophyllum distichum TaxID=126358 RepID=A0ABD1R253_9LAMI